MGIHVIALGVSRTTLVGWDALEISRVVSPGTKTFTLLLFRSSERTLKIETQDSWVISKPGQNPSAWTDPGWSTLLDAPILKLDLWTFIPQIQMQRTRFVSPGLKVAWGEGLASLCSQPSHRHHHRGARTAWGTGSLSSKSQIYSRAPLPTLTPLDSDEGKSQPPSRRKWRGALSCLDGGTASGEQWGWARGVGGVPWQPCHRHKPHYLAVPQAASLLTQSSSRLRR